MIALAEANVVSVAATELISVSNTPDLKLSTSIFDNVLLSASIVLFVKVCVSSKSTSVASDIAVFNSARVPVKVLSVKSIDLFVRVSVVLAVIKAEVVLSYCDKSSSTTKSKLPSVSS